MKLRWKLKILHIRVIDQLLNKYRLYYVERPVQMIALGGQCQEISNFPSVTAERLPFLFILPIELAQPLSSCLTTPGPQHVWGRRWDPSSCQCRTPSLLPLAL